MHELSICEAVLPQVLGLVPPPGATVIGQIVLRIGPPAGSSQTSFGSPFRWSPRAHHASAH
jgi:Zn finger protein HypA/HybF involved in hydrogenase expression